MKTKLTLLMLALSGCTSQHPVTPQPSPQYPAETPSAPKATGLPGQFYAQRVTGDFAGYPQLNDFIVHMETVHGIPREYLYGLFSQARRWQPRISSPIRRRTAMRLASTQIVVSRSVLHF